MGRLHFFCYVLMVLAVTMTISGAMTARQGIVLDQTMRAVKEYLDAADVGTIELHSFVNRDAMREQLDMYTNNRDNFDDRWAAEIILYYDRCMLDHHRPTEPTGPGVTADQLKTFWHDTAYYCLGGLWVKKPGAYE